MLNAPPQIVTETQAAVNAFELNSDLRKREVDHEDLDEDRRVSDDLDVDRGELADDRDAVRTRGAEDDADEEAPAIEIRRDLDGVLEPVEELAPVLRTNAQRS